MINSKDTCFDHQKCFFHIQKHITSHSMCNITINSLVNNSVLTTFITISQSDLRLLILDVANNLSFFILILGCITIVTTPKITILTSTACYWSIIMDSIDVLLASWNTVWCEKYYVIVVGQSLTRWWNVPTTSWSPCYIERCISTFAPIRFIIHGFVSEKIERDLVRKKKLKFWQTLAPKNVKITWFLEFSFRIRLSCVWKSLKSILSIILNTNRNLLFLAISITKDGPNMLTTESDS